jgi:CDP-diacylglycerol--glycerol-3-phosphate 3-phosphatidyltransferase
MKHLPNILSVSRIVFAVLFVLTFMQVDFPLMLWGFCFFLLGSLTDFLDGYLARKYNLISSFGKIIDPIADKVLILAAFFVLAVQNVFALWMIVVIAIREIIITSLRLKACKQGLVLAAEKSGKVKTASQFIVLIIAMVFVLAFSYHSCYCF